MKLYGRGCISTYSIQSSKNAFVWDLNELFPNIVRLNGMFVSEGSRIFEELFKVIVYGRITKMQSGFKLWEENIGPAFTAVVAGIHDLAVNRMLKGKRTRIFAFGVCSFGECDSVIPFRTWNIG